MNKLVQTIFIIDDDADVRDSLTELLGSVGLKVQTYCSANEFLNSFDSCQSGCVLVDVRMPGMSGIELQRDLNKLGVMLPVIIMTGHGDVTMAIQAMKDGAFEFLQKPFRDQELLDAISNALEKEKITREKRSHNEEIQRRIDSLTVRERQVIDRVLEGKSNKIIARELEVSDRTIEIHRSHAMQKLEATSIAEMVRIMLNENYV